MRMLSRIEEIILLAIWRLQENAYGVTIWDEVDRVTGKKWKLGAIYGPLGRLEKNGFVKGIEGEPTAERGGRRKVFYELTKDGKEALREIYAINSANWAEVPTFVE